MSSGPRRRAANVTIIARNRETVDGLQAYLQRAGVASRALRTLGDSSMIPTCSSAVVLFPDDFESAEVILRISMLRAERPRLLIVVVTSEPQRLRSALGPEPESLLPVIFPKPAFGWTILDTITGRAFSQSTG
jgi:hypothetical protein